MKFRFLAASALLIACIVLLVRWQFPAAPVEPLSEGAVSMSGVLVATELSLDRRGTHVLRQNESDIAFVESNVLILRDYEGLPLVVTGLLEANSDPHALPVLVASGVTKLDVPLRRWTIASLDLSFEAPVHWDAQTFDDGIRMVRAGESHPMLQVYRAGMNTLPQGKRMSLAHLQGVIVANAEGPTVFLAFGNDVFAFSYRGSPMKDGVLPADFLLLLRSVRLGSTASSSSQSSTVRSAPSLSSEQAALPCGGVGGVLCPAGSYCEISDVQAGIGTCKPLR